MGIVAYAFFSFGLTALISLVVTGIIVLVSKITNRNKGAGEEAAE